MEVVSGLVIYEYGPTVLLPFKNHFFSSTPRLRRYRVGINQIERTQANHRRREFFQRRRQPRFARKNQLASKQSRPQEAAAPAAAALAVVVERLAEQLDSRES